MSPGACVAWPGNEGLGQEGPCSEEGVRRGGRLRDEGQGRCRGWGSASGRGQHPPAGRGTPRCQYPPPAGRGLGAPSPAPGSTAAPAPRSLDPAVHAHIAGPGGRSRRAEGDGAPRRAGEGGGGSWGGSRRRLAAAARRRLGPSRRRHLLLPPPRPLSSCCRGSGTSWEPGSGAAAAGAPRPASPGPAGRGLPGPGPPGSPAWPERGGARRGNLPPAARHPHPGTGTARTRPSPAAPWHRPTFPRRPHLLQIPSVSSLPPPGQKRRQRGPLQ